jgi:DNA polymerase-3 subunit beta
MKTKVESNAFIAALKRAHGIIDTKNPQTILTHCLLRFTGKTLDVCATDTVTSVSSTVNGSASADKSVAVPGRAIYDAAKSMPAGELTIDVDSNNRIALSSGSARIVIPGIDGSDFPAMPKEPEEFLPIGARLFANAIQKTVFAASNDESRPIMSSVVVSPGKSSVRASAVDGHRLAVMDLDIGLALPEMIIPRKSAVIIAAMLEEGAEDAELAHADGKLFVRLENCLMVANLIDSRPIDIAPLLVTNADAVEVPREDLVGALRRASLMATKDIESALLTLSEGGLVVESTNEAVGEARTRIPVNSGRKWKFGASIRYLTDALSAMDVLTVDMFVTGERDAVLIRPHGGAWQTMIVMPVKI